MNVIDRAKAPTPKFFKVLRGIGLALASVGAAVIAAPISIPIAVVTVAGYLTVVGGVISAISQITVEDSFKNNEASSNE